MLEKSQSVLLYSSSEKNAGIVCRKIASKGELQLHWRNERINAEVIELIEINRNYFHALSLLQKVALLFYHRIFDILTFQSRRWRKVNSNKLMHDIRLCDPSYFLLAVSRYDYEISWWGTRWKSSVKNNKLGSFLIMAYDLILESVVIIYNM